MNEAQIMYILRHLNIEVHRRHLIVHLFMAILYDPFLLHHS